MSEKGNTARAAHSPGHGGGRGMGGHGKGPMGGAGGGPMGGAGEKAKDFSGSLKKLLRYLGAYLPIVIIALVLAVTAAVFTVIGPNKIKDIASTIQNELGGTLDVAHIAHIALSLVIIYSLGFLFNYFQGFILATVTQKTAQRLRTDVFRKINRLPFKYFDHTSYGDVLSRVTNDIDTLGTTMNQSISMLVTAITQFIGALIMMFWNNWILALCAVAASLVGFGLMSLIIGRSQKFFFQQQQELGRLNGHIEEIYSGHTVVKAYNDEKRASDTFHTINNRLFGNAWKSQFFSGIMMPIMQFVGNFGYVVVCVVGAALFINKKIEFGVIVAFMMYIRQFTNPMSQFAQATTQLQSTAAAGERVFDFLAEEEMSDESEKTAVVENPTGDVEFKDVHFGYDPETIIIKDFSAHAKPGQKVAIVGPTGAGKTTIVNLLMRFYELNSGDILIDGVSTKAMKRESVHDLFCMVLQDTWLFEGTLRENIVYSKQDVTEEQLIRAVKAVGLYHFIRTLPQGFDTVLGDNASLSAGQRQLVTIARAMIENSPLLILDEATSNVDTRTELVIQQAMDQLTRGRTSFVIAHRLSTIKNADIILVMNHGDIVESGSHADLLARGGFYAELYNSQFESV